MNSLLNISEGTSLAFHGLAMMAEKSPERLNVKVLAKALDASEAHLAKVMQRLNKAGMISSVRGPSGGFILNKAPQEIDFLQIYEIIESSVNLAGCPLGKATCSQKRCIFDGTMQNLNKQIYSALKQIRLSDFARDNKSEERGRI